MIPRESPLSGSGARHFLANFRNRDIDISFFVITVDLWDESALKEVNLVKHAANSPSISTASAVAYPHTPAGTVSGRLTIASAVMIDELQSASQPYLNYQNNTYSSSPVSLHQTSQPGNYYPTPAPQGYATPQQSYSQYNQSQYGYSHSSFGPNSGQSNGQYVHTSQQIAPNHPAYLVHSIPPHSVCLV